MLNCLTGPYFFEVNKIGDITCKVCGEPYDAFGVYHGDMSPAEKTQFLRGKGCPSCKGNPNKCELEWTYKNKPNCEFWDWGRCKNKEKCDHKYTVKPRIEEFLHSLFSNTDEDPISFLG